MKETFLILGSMHLNPPNNEDLYQVKSERIKSEKRQVEIQELINCLARFKPTKIALEISRTLDTNLEQDYHNYLEEKYKLGTNEKHQIGFKLAKQLGHNKLYIDNTMKRF